MKKNDNLQINNISKIKNEGNFRNPVFDKFYHNENLLLHENQAYSPNIKNGLLQSKNDIFVFGYNKIIYNGNFYTVIRDYSRNIYMWLMFREYLDKILHLYPICNRYNLGIEEKNSLKVLPKNFNGKIYNMGDYFVRRVSIYINNVCVSQSTLYIYLGMKQIIYNNFRNKILYTCIIQN